MALTTEEFNNIVNQVMAQIEDNALDFDVQITSPESNDYLMASRLKSDGTYSGIIIKWQDVAKVVTDVAVQAKTDAVNAKDIAQQILAQVQSKGTEITNFVATSKEEIRNIYKDDLNAAKQELDDKKITKFYASNNGNMSLPDSDNGKPSDMKIFGKSVQNGTPSPSNPIEIQSVVNPTVKMTGKNLCLAKDVYLGADAYLVTTLDGRDCVRFTSGNTIKNKPIEFKENTQYTVSFDLKMVQYISGGGTEIVFTFFYTDGSMSLVNSLLADFTFWKRVTKSSDANKTVSSIGVYVNDYRTYCYVSDFQLEEGSTATRYVPYEATSASLPYTLNAIPVTSGGNVTIDGKQYIADYVDVERRKLVRMVGSVDLGTLNWSYATTGRGRFQSESIGIKNPSSSTVKANVLCPKYEPQTADNVYIGTTGIGVNSSTLWIYDSSYTDASTFKSAMSGVRVLYELATPTYTDLTESDITALSSLATYYPITNGSIKSSQLDGYAIFNYPLNMANGWNYVMQQIGETKPIIYDTQVKTIENLIDTAILTAMMEA